MKKLLLIIFGLFLTIGFIGCNSDGSDINIDMDEFIATPTNLEVSGTTLSWDAVDNANGYTVYVDGEEEDKVSNTSFDFSDLDGDVLVFQVQTRAPRGMQDSPLSVSIAYVENKEAEVAAVKTALASNEMMDVDEDFAEELVNKGMTASEVSDVVDGIDDFNTAMENSTSAEDYIAALRDLIDEFENVEAFVSAIVKTEFATMLTNEITSIQETITRYEGYNDPYYDSRVEELETEKAMFQDLLDEVNDNPDRIVLAITATIEYFLSVEEMVTDDLVDMIMDLGETEDIDGLDVDELELIKEEIVNILRDTMPTENDLILVMDLVEVVSQITGGDLSFDTEVENYKGKMAAQSLYSLELFINFLDSFDSRFFDDLQDQIDADQTEEMLGAEVLILVVKVFDNFYDDNENLMDTISEMYTDEEKELVYSEYQSLLSEFATPSGVASIYTIEITDVEGYSYQDMLDLQVVFEDAFGVLLDKLVATDGEVIRQYFINQGFDYRYYEQDYVNTVTGIEYDTYEEFSSARNAQQFDLYHEILILVEEVMASLDEEDANDLLKYSIYSLYSTLSAQLQMYEDYGRSYGELPYDQDDIDALVAVLFDACDDLDADALEILQKVFKYIVDEEVMMGVKELQAELAETDDYKDEDYAMIILFAGYYDDFMSSRNRGTVDDIVAVVFAILGDDAATTLTEMSASELTVWENAVDGILDLLETEFNEIKGYDYTDLSAQEIQNIEDFYQDFEDLVMSFNLYD